MSSTPAADRRTRVGADEDDELDPNDRVHHHAKVDGRATVSGGVVITLCGLRLKPRPRPTAAQMPCCPMCAAEMEALGRRCSHGPT